VSIMGNRGLVLDGNTGGTPTDNSGKPCAFVRLALVAAGLLSAGVTLRACADRLATFHTCRFSERLNGLLISL
jgi:hypothetical protein